MCAGIQQHSTYFISLYNLISSLTTYTLTLFYSNFNLHILFRVMSKTLQRCYEWIFCCLRDNGFVLSFGNRQPSGAELGR